MIKNVRVGIANPSRAVMMASLNWQNQFILMMFLWVEIREGYDADFIVLGSKNLDLVATYLDGRNVTRRRIRFKNRR